MKIMLAIAVSTTLIAVSASAQTRDQSSKEIEASGGVNDYSVDKRSAEKSGPCTKRSSETRGEQQNPDGNNFYEGWPVKWAKSEPSPDGSGECQNGVFDATQGAGVKVQQ